MYPRIKDKRSVYLFQVSSTNMPTFISSVHQYLCHEDTCLCPSFFGMDVVASAMNCLCVYVLMV